jgi:fluoride exporter
MAEREPAVAREPEPAGPAWDPGRPAGRRHGARVLAVISAGGVLGALARDGLTLALPTPAGGVPWATLLVNVSGCLLIGVLMVLVVEVWEAHPLVRPFLGVGVLGGYTTFSTAVVDVQRLIVAGRPAVALGYLAGTAAAALAAVQVGVVLTRAAALPRPAGCRRSRDGGTR